MSSWGGCACDSGVVDEVSKAFSPLVPSQYAAPATDKMTWAHSQQSSHQKPALLTSTESQCPGLSPTRASRLYVLGLGGSLALETLGGAFVQLPSERQIFLVLALALLARSLLFQLCLRAVEGSAAVAQPLQQW